MQWRQIAHGSDDYLAACRLRQEILRTPLGLVLSAEELAAETTHWHFGLFSEQHDLAACVSIVPVDTDTGKLRQMAVAAGFQHQGLGQKLVVETEHYLQTVGMKHVMLHARVSAVTFYRKLGYQPVGDIFTEVGIPHQKMTRTMTTA